MLTDNDIAQIDAEVVQKIEALQRIENVSEADAQKLDDYCNSKLLPYLKHKFPDGDTDTMLNILATLAIATAIELLENK